MLIKEIKQLITANKKYFETQKPIWDYYLSVYNSQRKGYQDELPSGSRPDSKEVIKINTNYPFGYIDTVISMVVPVIPTVEAVPRNVLETQEAEAQSQLVNASFKVAKMQEILAIQAAKAIIYGCSYVKVIWDTKKKTPKYYERDPRRVWIDADAAKWEDMRYVIEVTFVKKSVVEQRIKNKQYKLKDKLTYTAKPTWISYESFAEADSNADNAFQWATIYEVLDLESNRYYHIEDSSMNVLYEGPLPYGNIKNHYVQLKFNENLTDLRGLSDIQLIINLQIILNEIDNLELHHAAATIPAVLMDSRVAQVEEQLLAAIAKIQIPGLVIPVQISGQYQLKDLFGQTPVPTLSPSFAAMRTRVMQAIEFILGLPQYARGVVGVTEVATEAALADTALRTRTGRRINKVNDVMEALAFMTLNMYRQELGKNESIRIEPERGKSEIVLNKKDLGFTEQEFYAKFEAVKHSPMSNNKQFRLQTLQQVMPLLQTNPNIDQAKLTQELLSLLEMDHVFQPTPPPPPMPPMAPGGLGGLGALAGLPNGAGSAPPGSVAGGQDVSAGGLPNIDGGELPPGVAIPPTVPLPGRPVMANQ